MLAQHVREAHIHLLLELRTKSRANYASLVRTLTKLDYRCVCCACRASSALPPVLYLQIFASIVALAFIRLQREPARIHLACLVNLARTRYLQVRRVVNYALSADIPALQERLQPPSVSRVVGWEFMRGSVLVHVLHALWVAMLTREYRQIALPAQ